MALLRLIRYELRKVFYTYLEYIILLHVYLAQYTRTHKYNETYEILEFSYNKANNII